jgi:hypothetical protein
VATEDVVFMLHGMGIATGLDLDALVDAGAYISGVLGRPPVSRVAARCWRGAAAAMAAAKAEGQGTHGRLRPRASPASRRPWPNWATRMRRCGWTCPRAPRRRRPTRWA